MLKVVDLKKTFDKGLVTEKEVLKGISLELKEGDFVTVIGSNGAGKSTLLNSIAGTFSLDEGQIFINDKDVTNLKEFQRAKYIGRVFQDPLTGTAADMWIEENLALANRRGNKRGLKPGITNEERKKYFEVLKGFDLSLENRMTTKVGLLSGGQRQALTLLMATLHKPQILLLDEHTAALDPKTATKVLELTNKVVTENHLTTFMVTHNMKDALKYGNRLIMMNGGKIILDVSGKDKEKLEVNDLLKMFDEAGGVVNDNMILN